MVPRIALPLTRPVYRAPPALNEISSPRSRPLAVETREALRALQESPDAWRHSWSPLVRKDVRQLLNHYVTYWLGHRPRLLPYLGS